MSEENGFNHEEKTSPIRLPDEGFPKLTLTFNPDSQGLTMSFDEKQIKTWEMVIMMLTAAMQQAEFNRNMVQGQAMQRAQVEAMQAAAVKQQLQGKKLGR